MITQAKVQIRVSAAPRTRRAVLGTSAKLWRLELTSKAPAATPIAVVDSKLLNGLSAVPGLPDLVLAADSDIGAVYSINMRTGAARIALQDAAMAAGASTPALGINGLCARDGALYFTNSEKRTFARVTLAAGRGGVQQGGAVRVLGTAMPATSMYDDFAMDSEGRAWVATPPGAATLLFPRANGTWGQELAAGDPVGGEGVFMKPSSGAFGRAERTEKTLYVTTGGGQVLSVNTGGGDV
ncbi:hypothetical protein B0H17DRAFT_924723 [Mycena rosella]|uniref:SMP-30/Gluconolactonase/LRE-like region domain-containing protein n=1 Tax=Mycena rosella TaxID=1033263 RepID=A0AAD7DYC0_MYCRO|nr:hypothetical protein B0H17DRAFT_924723 [Mycena rosella]